MKAYQSTVTIVCETAEQADVVLAERLGYDEDYGFDYGIQTWAPAVEERPNESEEIIALRKAYLELWAFVVDNLDNDPAEPADYVGDQEAHAAVLRAVEWAKENGGDAGMPAERDDEDES